MPAAADAPDKADVLVVGAGFSGLSAALALVDAGRSVTVVEAEPRVGGRTRSGMTADGQWLELGGQWVGPEHLRLRALIARFGLSTEPSGRTGAVVRVTNGIRTEIGEGEEALAVLSPADAADVRQAAERFAAIVDSVDMASPWSTPGAESLDRGTFADWIDRSLGSPAARSYFSESCEAIFAPDPVDVSLLHAAYYFGSGGHIRSLLGVSREAQEERVTGGASAVCVAIGELLGERVVTGAAVRTIRVSDGVEAITRDGARFRARHVIVTLPPPLAGRLEYDPIMPSRRDQLTQRLHAISVVKLYLVYETPFWADAGLSGEGVLDAGPIRVVLDNTPVGYPRGVLVAFIEGADTIGPGPTDAESRRDAFLAAAVLLFGARAADPLEYLEFDWMSEEFARGCYSGHLAPGTWTRYGPALTESVGPIHWAGTETAGEWTGYMEGAVRSGERVAAEVLAALAAEERGAL
ncbi:oxidoreductase [Amnibacterium flavum]|uniref:Oxidoreductase n=1 Tax=Amnibacterium flavum TaxID=2173173 RepID=A0A2V1HWQ8_9MICO|nr:oxidoreductase [Amnibacterium flavum]